MRLLTTFLLLLLCAWHVTAQTPYLERVITISFNGIRIDDALRQISKQGGFTFSYSPAAIETSKQVTFNFSNKTVREVLDHIFQGAVEYKQRGKYIILTKAQVSSGKKEEKILSGYVVDEATGERLKNVSIYDPVTLSSAITDSYGYFEIKIDKPSVDVILSVNKQNYSDTLVTVPRNNGNRLLNIPIKINKEKISVVADSVGQKIKRFWKSAFSVFKNANIINIDDTIYRKAQFSIVPFIGTNHKLSGNVINNYSLNLFGGYSLGVKKLEVGGLFNIVRGNVNGVQLAGTFNGVIGDVEGAQFGGVFNMVGGSLCGAQLAGVFNANRGTVAGAQLAGVINFNLQSSKHFSGAGVINFNNGHAAGVKLAGVGNINIGEQKGPQAAGVFNVTTQNASAIQLAGTYNLAAKNIDGVQAAGVLNIAGKNVKGAQISGLLNFAGKDVKGAQVGLMNYARKINGTQVGLLNIADSVKGIPVGFMSLVWKGYHKIEISADEIFYTNIAFRTGVRQFYNIFTAGAKPNTLSGDQTYWTFGYGIGTAPKISKKLFLNFDFTANQIVQDNSFDHINLLNKFYMGVDFQLFRKLSLTMGATLNGYVTDNTFNDYKSLFTDYTPSIVREENFSDDHYNFKMWWGGKIGIRFL